MYWIIYTQVSLFKPLKLVEKCIQIVNIHFNVVYTDTHRHARMVLICHEEPLGFKDT